MSGFIPAPEQLEATRPDQSNWVSANAGSGKTHVLTQRVARLLLAGAAPQKILCLTYTKAAAAEMQTRLFQTLGSWAMEPTEALATRLGALSGGDPVNDAEAIGEARRLFARALETPGGLKIQTIHAFCDMLLGRFPLEAGVSPRFEVIDDRASAQMRDQVYQGMARDAEIGRDDAFDDAAQRLNEGGIDDLTSGVLANRAEISAPDLEGRLAAHFGVVAERTVEEVAKAAIGLLDADDLKILATSLEQFGGKKVSIVAAAIRTHVPDFKEPTLAAEDLANALLRKKDWAPRSDLVTKSLRQDDPTAETRLGNLANWAQATREAMQGVKTVARTRDLHSFAASLLHRLKDSKATSGLLDFDDLITAAEGLLKHSHMRSWVLFKLDQGIDHILVDEAQDTSPTQWSVIAAIAEEFFAGEGARTDSRSLFVVGDEKQSIYSFQGADPRAFGTMREYFRGRLAALGAKLGEPRLLTSYRSAPAILEFVDAVFQGDAGRGLTGTNDPIIHRAHRARDVGRVDLWPPIKRTETEDPRPWYEPVDAPLPQNPKKVLAQKLAKEISRMISSEFLPPRDGQPGRKIRPSDILVLVGKRDILARSIIRELKNEGVPVAGADRMSLTAELAVQDLMVLIRFVLMPSDDLSLAALLRSPLCAVTEDDLFALAHPRDGTLWQALQTSGTHDVVSCFLRDMAGQADYLRPYEFLERVLVHHGGRQKLLARLGSEAEDSIDELLNQSLAYESREPASLTGFLAWLEAADVDVKREMEHGLDVVRIMTVHGAKGLEAPIVVLPDTFSGLPSAAGRPVFLQANSDGNKPPLIIWAAASDEDDPIARQAREATRARDAAERDRLLYVALTRAEDWLILCGAEPTRPSENSWYIMLEAGFEKLPTESMSELKMTGIDEVVRRFETGPKLADSQVDKTSQWSVPPPEAFQQRQPAPRETGEERASPSGLSHKAGVGGLGRGRELALRHGVAVHALLEVLPEVDGAARNTSWVRLLDGRFGDLSQSQRLDVLKEAEQVLELPEASLIFGPGSLAEVTFAIDRPDGGLRMIGRSDRIILTDTSCLLVDIKTDPLVPETAQDVEAAYLAQLGAYASAAAQTWPKHRQELAILWTAGPRFMPVPGDLCETAFRSASFARTGNA